MSPNQVILIWLAVSYRVNSINQLDASVPRPEKSPLRFYFWLVWFPASRALNIPEASSSQPPTHYLSYRELAMARYSDPEEAYFRSIPWCAHLLSSPDVIITPTDSRRPKSSTEDALIAETFKTKNTIHSWLSFYRSTSRSEHRIEELSTFLSLEYGINGYPHIAHGGVVATIIDEVMGVLIMTNQKLGLVATEGDIFTAELKVRYLKPVKTPQVVLVTSTFKKVKGKKHFLEATVRDEEGTVLCVGEALWIGTGKPRGKL
jgi:acyl-coenzyme A thioesterase PaaI-like protein